jgi:hypothetical protein
VFNCGEKILTERHGTRFQQCFIVLVFSGSQQLFRGSDDRPLSSPQIDIYCAYSQLKTRTANNNSHCNRNGMDVGQVHGKFNGSSQLIVMGVLCVLYFNLRNAIV